MNKQTYTPVRFSHLTSYAGIGAIVRGAEDRLMVLADTRYWCDRDNKPTSTEILYVNRIKASLNIDQELHMPPIATETVNGLSGSYLPAILFPRFTVCKKCGLLHNQPWKKQNKKLHERVYCEAEACQGLLEQVTWCAVSSQGHLAEVPWHFICHDVDENKQCKADYQSAYLKVVSNKSGKRQIHCSRCGSKNTFENVKNLNFIHQQQPWIFDGSPELDEGDSVEILEVNNPGVYLPERVNALVIPPESRISKATIVDQLYRNSKLCREIDAIRLPLPRKSKIGKIAQQFRTSHKKVEQALKQIKEGYPNIEEFVVEDLYHDEYLAFLQPLENQQEDEDFVTDHLTKTWQTLLSSNLPEHLTSIIHAVDHLIAAKRLREIQVFKGFYRISSENKDKLVPPDIIGKSDCLPAIELFGEGLFFTLNETLLQQWEILSTVVQRADEVKKRYETAQISMARDVEVTPRFILLHTLSHLLIRELEVTSGYPAASLKERIYSSRSKKMAGILIYTAVPDIAGSLGGIINSANPKYFLDILDNVFKKAQWCSLDPVCTEHEGQGPGWLNRAACHACSLIPEPSCEYGNVFLDRVFVKGSEEKGIPSFLGFIDQHKGRKYG